MTTKTRLLIVEDDSHLLLGLRDILEMEGYAVTTADNGQDALHVLHSEATPPDLIISDIMMPHMDGLQLLEAVRQNPAWVTIPFIFLTARDAREDVHRGKALGVDEYLVKPFDIDELRLAVESRLMRHRAITEVHQEQVSDIKRNILNVLNHEFRTPLTLVVAYADMLDDPKVDSMSQAELLEFLKGVSSGAQRLRRLIENFIFLMELDSGEASQMFSWRRREISPAHYPDMVKYALDNVRVQCENHQIVVDLSDDLPPVVGDFEYLSMALRELINNAVKFSPAGSTVRIRFQDAGDHLLLTVSDEGRGIPASEHENIWKPFHQVNRELYEDQGSGAGLAIVDGVIRLHEGRRAVESTPGQGSVFSLYLPAAK